MRRLLTVVILLLFQTQIYGQNKIFRELKWGMSQYNIKNYFNETDRYYSSSINSISENCKLGNGYYKCTYIFTEGLLTQVNIYYKSSLGGILNSPSDIEFFDVLVSKYNYQYFDTKNKSYIVRGDFIPKNHDFYRKRIKYKEWIYKNNETILEITLYREQEFNNSYLISLKPRYPNNKEINKRKLNRKLREQRAIYNNL